MNTINVLVTGIGRPIAQGIIQGLRERRDVSIIGTDRRKVTSGHHFCDQTYQLPRYTDIEAYIDTVHKISEKEKSTSFSLPFMRKYSYSMKAATNSNRSLHSLSVMISLL